jgi:hypothetical protein
MSRRDNLYDTRYDLIGELEKLLIEIDVNDEPTIVRRAIELQAFRVSLFYPRFTQLPVSGKIRSPPVDMIALARRHAALVLYRHYTRHPGLSSWKTDENGLILNFKCVELLLELLKDYLHVEKGGLSELEKDISQHYYVNELVSQLPKSRPVGILIDAYMTNGGDLHGARGQPVGLKIMREALCDPELYVLPESTLVKLSERTLANYFDELEPTSVFHYLIQMQDCGTLLNPSIPRDSRFTQILMQRARFVDELRAACLLYNAVVLELNGKYRFAFTTIENVPKPKNKTIYDSLVLYKTSDELTDAIKTVRGLRA